MRLVKISWVRCTSSHGPTSPCQVSEVYMQRCSQSRATKKLRKKKKERIKAASSVAGVQACRPHKCQNGKRVKDKLKV